LAPLNLFSETPSSTLSPTYKSDIVAIATKLRGPENRKLSRKNDIRFGTNGSLSVVPETGQWFDYEHGDGGGVLKMVMHYLSLSKQDAIEWLKSEGYAETKFMDNNEHCHTTEYEYSDAQGAPIMKVVRKDFPNMPKRIKQMSFRDGDWQNGVKGIETPLFQLPEVLKACSSGQTIVIVEGEKCVLAAQSLGLVSTCNPGGAGKWKPHHSEYLRGADVVIVPDNDEAGRKHAATVQASLTGVAKTIKIVELPGLPQKGDIYDWISAGGTRGDFEALAQNAAPIANETSYRWPVTVGNKIVATAAPLALIENLLFQGDFSVVYGQPKCGKTFFVLDMAARVATGAYFLGKKTRKGAVIYVAGEGARGFRLRLEGWRDYHDVDFDDVPFIMVDGAPKIRGEENDTAHLIELAAKEAAKLGHDPVLIIIDTLARSFNGGNENAAEDMGQFVDACKELQTKTGAHVLVVHHAGKNSENGMRGSSALLGAADLVIKVTKSGDNHIVDVEAAKDIPLESLGGFRLQPHDLGRFDDGSQKNSAVAVPIDGPIRKPQKLNNRLKIAIDELKHLIAKEGITPPIPEIPNGVKVVPLKSWRDALAGCSLVETTNTGRSVWKRIKEDLLAKKVIMISEDHVWLL